MDKFLIVKGRIWNGEPDSSFSESFLVRNDTIIAAGGFSDMQQLAPDGTELIDVGENTVFPGMTDAHTHFLAFAELNLYVNMQPAQSFEEAMEMLSSAKDSLQPGGWIHGVNYNEVPWGVTRVTRRDLDKFFPDNPVMISRYCGHVHVANTAALKAASMMDANDINIPKDENGDLLGILNEGAGAPMLDIISRIFETDERKEKLMSAACLAFSSVGITTIHDCDAPTYALGTDLKLLQRLDRHDKLTLRIITYHDRMPNYNLATGFGNNKLSFGGFKVFTDGSVGGHTAAMTRPYADDLSTCGCLNHSNEELYDLIAGAHVRDIQVQIHAIGDLAVTQVVDTLEKIIAKYGRPRLPYRLNHGSVTTQALVDRLQSLGVAFDIQPSQAFRNRVMSPARLGPERSKNSFCFRRFWKTGLPVNSSSDAPIETISPWWGIWTLCTRTNLDGTKLAWYDPDEVLPLVDAIRTYTLNPWTTIGKDHEYGKLLPGYKADFTVVEGNPFDMPLSELRHVQNVMTFCGGEKVWSK